MHSKLACPGIESPDSVCRSAEASAAREGLRRNRNISPQAGKALEKLGHAVDYLTDELVHDCGSVLEDNGRIQAIQMLMARNRQIYFECPVKLALAEKLHIMTSRLLSFRA